MTAMLRRLAPVGGAFELVDHDGRSVTDADFRGRFVLIFFGFTNCRLVCPRALERLSGALDDLGPMAELVVPLYISVDPARDTPQRMRDFLSAWPRFTGLTGSIEQIEAVKTAFRVFARRREGPGGYDVPHSAITHLLDSAGRHVDHWPDVLSAGEISDRLFIALCPHFHLADVKGLDDARTN